MTQQMYIGPAIPGVVKSNAVFIGGLPEQLKDAIKELPVIHNLVISVDKITDAKKALNENGSVEDVSYCRIAEYFKGEKLNV